MPSSESQGISKEDVVVSQDYLTITELAAKLKVPNSWIYARTRLKGPGTIPHLKIGKYLRFSLEEVLAWLKHQQNNN